MHSERHVLLYGTNPLSNLKLDNGKLAGRGPVVSGVPVPPLAHPAYPSPISLIPALPSLSPMLPLVPLLPTPTLPCTPALALFSGPPCSWRGQRLRGFGSHILASLHRAHGTADVCIAILW